MINLIFGDSITLGLWDIEGGWVDRLKRTIHSQEVKKAFSNYHEVYNLGVDGNFTRDIIERFDNEVKARLWPVEEYSFIFAVGINDTLHRDNVEFESTPEKYQKELTTLFEKAKQYSDKISFIDLNPVDESLTNPLKISTTGKCYTNDRINDFNAALHDFCFNHPVELIRIHENFILANQNSLLIDGLHPNDKGHELIYNAVLPILMKFLNTN